MKVLSFAIVSCRRHRVDGGEDDRVTFSRARATGVGVGVGLTLVVVSVVPAADTGQWFSDLLLGVGVAISLFTPLYLVGRRLDDHIDSVRSETVSMIDDARNETTSRVDELADRVTTFEAEVERRLDDVAETVSSRLAEERQRDSNAFKDLAETPTRDALLEAMLRAVDLDIINLRTPPRVQVGEEDLYIKLDLSLDRWGLDHGLSPESVDRLSLELVDLEGNVVESAEWPDDRAVEDVLVQLGRAAQRKTSSTEFDARDFFTGLSDLLLVGHRSPSYRPIVMLCPPQWAIKVAAAVRYDGRPAQTYAVGARALRERPDLVPDVHRKPWINHESFDAAQEALESLFPPPSADPWGDPPF